MRLKIILPHERNDERLKLKQTRPDLFSFTLRNGALDDFHGCWRIPVCQEIEHTNGGGIDDQHSAADNSTMVVSESIIHEWHPTSA